MTSLEGARADRVPGGMFWAGLTQALSKGMTAVATLVLARLLMPSDFGLFALGTVIINYLDRVKDVGIGAGLIYRKEEWDRLARTGLVVTAGFSTLLAVVTFVAAPAAEVVFDTPKVTGLIRVLAISLFLSGLAVVPETRLRRALDFRRRLIPEAVASVVKGTVSITLAAAGFGVWSLAWGQVAGTAVSLMLYWWLASWRPRLAWDRTDAKHLLSYGIPSASVAIFAVLHENLDYLLIGLRMTDDELGYYVLAFRVPELVVIGICLIVSQVMFPYLSRLQDDRNALGNAYLRTLRLLCVITVPAGVLLSLLAPQVVATMYAEGWGASVAPLRVLALFTVAYAIGFTAGDVFKAVGRPGILNTVAVVKLVALVPGLWWATGRSITWVAVVLLVTNIGQSALKLAIARRLLHLSMSSIVDALLPSIASAAAMAVVVFLTGASLPPLPAAAELLLLGGVGSASYALVLRWLDPAVVKGAVGMIATSIGRSRRAGKST